jgi:malic enzyme
MLAMEKLYLRDASLEEEADTYKEQLSQEKKEQFDTDVAELAVLLERMSPGTFNEFVVKQMPQRLIDPIDSIISNNEIFLRKAQRIINQYDTFPITEYWEIDWFTLRKKINEFDTLLQTLKEADCLDNLINNPVVYNRLSNLKAALEKHVPLIPESGSTEISDAAAEILSRYLLLFYAPDIAEGTTNISDDIQKIITDCEQK